MKTLVLSLKRMFGGNITHSGETIMANRNAVDTSASTISELVAETKTRNDRKASFEEVGLEMPNSAAVGLPLA